MEMHSFFISPNFGQESLFNKGSFAKESVFFFALIIIHAADTDDFTMITQNLMFTPGDKQDYIEFDIVNDNKMEGSEWFIITAGIATATIGIADNFGMGYIVGVVGSDEGGGGFCMLQLI